MTELEAVNMLLEAIGSDVVNSLGTTPASPDVAAARRILQRKAKMELRKGWWFNTDYGVLYEPHVTTGEITLPATLSSIRMMDGSLIRRDGKLYDTVNQTYKFNITQTAYKQIRLPTWDEMEADMQVYVAYLAAVEFVRTETNDMNLQTVYGNDAGLALIELKRTDLQMKRLNMFDSYASRTVRNGVRPYGRLNGLAGTLVQDTLMVNK